jgi:hypothetical protein
MNKYIIRSMEMLVCSMKCHAETGHYDGLMISPYFERAGQVHWPTGTSLLFTRDIGYHASGFLKNPDYERCYHLSISFWDMAYLVPRPFEPKLAHAWVKAFFGDWSRYVWEEGPRLNLPVGFRHYRVFCSRGWQPILPRKEVYTRDFTPSDWKSWSEQHE